ncbi:MAG: hypothetical protein O7C61_04535 [SAR324 cluster bacterium]|nr:hypothetical protein [SAR324 cluster bacterium]
MMMNRKKFPRPCHHLLAWLLPALLLAGCADRMAQLRLHMADDSPIFVIYQGGTIITHVKDGFQSREKLPPEYRAIAATVSNTLQESMRGRPVIQVRAGQGEALAGKGLRALVLVNGGYVCEGEPPQYECALTMETRVTFRDGSSGQVVGDRLNLVGQVWYGRYPVTMSPVRGDDALAVSIDRRIKQEIPATMALEHLLSATEDGLTAFLEELRAHTPGG